MTDIKIQITIQEKQSKLKQLQEQFFPQSLVKSDDFSQEPFNLFDDDSIEIIEHLDKDSSFEVLDDRLLDIIKEWEYY